MVHVAYKANYNQGDVVFKAGDLFATEFYVIEAGAFDFQVDATLEAGVSDHDRMLQHALRKNCGQAGGVVRRIGSDPYGAT